MLRELNASKASSILTGTDLQESTANKLATIFSPAFEEAVSKKKPVEAEVASAKVLKKWLETKVTQIETTTASSKPLPGSLRLKETSVGEKPGRENLDSNAAARDNESDIAPVGAETKSNELSTYDLVITAIRKLERSHSITESKLSSAESMLRAKEETIAKLKASLDEANSRIAALKEANSEKLQQIDNASYRIEELQREIEETKSTANARAKMITMLDKNRDQKGNEALARIASKLKTDYGDFKEYEGEAMTAELGEIVKLQLGQVFETLKSAGVKL